MMDIAGISSNDLAAELICRGDEEIFFDKIDSKKLADLLVDRQEVENIDLENLADALTTYSKVNEIVVDKFSDYVVCVRNGEFITDSTQQKRVRILIVEE